MRLSLRNPKSGDKWILEIQDDSTIQELYSQITSISGILEFECNYSI